MDNSTDPTRPSVATTASIGHAFAIPCSQDVRPILTGFDSSDVQARQGPWVSQSPFNLANPDFYAVVFDTNGGSTTYRDALSTHAESSTDHLSAGGSIGVGCEFLKAEVSVEYDRTVIENESGTQASRNASCRLGRLMVDRFPAFTESSTQLLRSSGGPEKFRQLYGDYFVRGYTLGADAGLCLSARSHDRSQTESLKITVTVKVLWTSASASHTEERKEQAADAAMSICGYTTLRNEVDVVETKSASVFDQTRVRAVASKYMDRVAALEAEARLRLKELNVKDGQYAPTSTVLDMSRSGLVVQLLLFPFARLEEYVQNAPVVVQ